MSIKKEIDINKVIEMMEEGQTQAEIARYFKCNTRTLQRHIADFKAIDDDIVKTNVKLAKAKQRLQDINRIERKSFRLQVQKENAILEYEKKLVDIFTKHKLPEFVYKKTKTVKTDCTGIFHVTDVHFNELVDLVVNKYDFTIASKRIKKFVDKAKIYFKTHNVKNVLIAFTGDMMNSDRRLDELLSEATNRSKATFLAVSILEQMILDLSKDFNLTVASVIGNESRIGKEIGWGEAMASDNYDYTIYHILKLVFRGSNISFLDGNSVEKVVEASGQNILLFHGNQIKSTAMEQSIQKVKGKYTSRKINIDFIISGHLHSTRIGDTYARGSSVVGANAYSDGALQLESRASQNLHIIYKDGSRDSIKIDLQNTDGISGYPINKELEAYNAKSLSKAKKKVTISRIVG